MTKPKSAAAPEPVAHGPWIVAPSDSFGIEWRMRMPGAHEWYRKRARVGGLIESLAQTRVWRELEEVYFRSKQLPIAPKNDVLPTDEVVKAIADAQWGVRWLASRDRQTTLELDIATFELGVRVRVRDEALARVGSAAIDEVAAVFAKHARAPGGDEPAIGHAGPFGRGYMRNDETRAVLPGPAVLAAGEVHFRADALCTIFDRRPRENDEDEDDTAKATRKLATAKPPKGGKLTAEDDVVVVTFPCDVTDRDAVRAATIAHAQWIAGSAEVKSIPTSTPKLAKVAKKTRRADEKAAQHYTLWAFIDFVIDDDPYFFRDHAFFDVVYRAFAKTAYWSEVEKPGAAAIEAAIRAMKTGRNDTSGRHKRGDDLEIEITPNVNQLRVRVTAKKPILEKLRAHATRDLVAFAGEVHSVLAGRGHLSESYIGLDAFDWEGLVGLGDDERDGNWPRLGSVVDIFDPRAPEDGTNGRELYAARTLSAVPLPGGAERVEAGGLVAVMFADDLSDPIATAEACARRAAWLWSVQAL